MVGLRGRRDDDAIFCWLGEVVLEGGECDEFTEIGKKGQSPWLSRIRANSKPVVDGFESLMCRWHN